MKDEILKLPDNQTPQPKVVEHPGITAPQYTDIEVRKDKPFFTASVAIPTTATTGEYDLIDTTSIPFTPRAIRIQARMDGTTPSVSDMTSDGTTSGGLFTVGTTGWDYSDARMIRVYVDASNQLGADFVKFIKGGVRIDITTASFTAGDFVGCFITAWK